MEVKDTQERLTILQTYFPQSKAEVLANLSAFACDIWAGTHENCVNGDGMKTEAAVPRAGILDVSME